MKNKTASKIINTVFLAFIFAVGLLYAVMPKSEFSETEKRYLAGFPEFSFKSLFSGDFSSDFEEFLSDQTPFRSFFVSVNSYFQLAKGNNGADGVYLGSDGWLIEKPFDRSNRFDGNIGRISKYAKECGVPCAILAVPSKGYIYSGALPKNALRYEDGEYLEKIASVCGNDMTVIDISDAMQSAKNEKQLFYKTDHHWTSDGAFLAYGEACKALGLSASAESDFDIETGENFFGTSYASSCYTLTPPDTVKLMRSKKTGGAAEVTIDDGGKEKYDNMFFTEALSESDKYVVFLDGNHSLVRIKTGNEGGKLLLIKDSFAHCIAPFFAENYSEIVMIDLRYYRKPVSELVSAEAPDQIMFLYGMENLAESADIILK